MSWLPGTSLADVWNDVNYENKELLLHQVGKFAQSLHKSSFSNKSKIKKDWPSYHENLLNNCIQRHQKNDVPENLVNQIGSYLKDNIDYFDNGCEVFIHMDLHPWNLMVEYRDGAYHLSGVLDFGDAIVGRRI